MFSDTVPQSMDLMSQGLFYLTIEVILAISFLLALFRLFRGPHIVDRIIAFDLLTAIFMGYIVFHAIVNNEDVYLDICLVMAIVVFLTTVAFSRFIELRAWKGKTMTKTCSSGENPPED